MIDGVANERTDYDYNARNELIDARSVTDPGGTQVHHWEYDYDSRSNRTEATLDGSTTFYTYNDANQLCRSGPSAAACGSGGGTAYSYNANGSLTTSTGGPALSYDDREHMETVTPSGGGSAVEYLYRGATQQDLMSFGTTELTPSVLGVRAQSDTAPLDLDTTYFTWTSDGTLLGQHVDDGLPTTDDDRYFYLTDGLGSIISVTDDTGAEVNRYSYDPYGQPLTATGTLDNPWRYAGGYHQPDLGAYKFGVRFMQPGQGRWTQVDPVETEHPYLYAGGNPINNIDPTGAIPEEYEEAIEQCGRGALTGGLVGGGTALIVGNSVVPAVGTALAPQAALDGAVSGCALSAGCSLFGDELGEAVEFGCNAVGSVVSGVTSLL